MPHTTNKYHHPILHPSLLFSKCQLFVWLSCLESLYLGGLKPYKQKSWCARSSEGGDEEAAGRGLGEEVGNFYDTHCTENTHFLCLVFHCNKWPVY